jgi:hypothetical protein
MLTLSGNATLSTASGVITVGSTGTLVVKCNAAAPKDNIIVEAGGELNLATGAVLTLTAGKGLTLTGATDDDGAKLTGAGSVVAGGTTITGGASGEWQAVGDNTTIEITADNITGTGTGATLAGVANDSAAIDVAAVAADTADITLTVTSATIDIGAFGVVTLTGNADNTPVSAIMVLKGATANPAALLFDVDTNGVDIATLVSGATKVTIDNGTDKPAEIKLGGASITAVPTSDTGVVLKAVNADISSIERVAGKLDAGNTSSTYDLSIVSVTAATNATSLSKISRIVSGK